MQAQAQAAIRDTLPEDTNGATAALVRDGPSNGDVRRAGPRLELRRHQVQDDAAEPDGERRPQAARRYKAITLATALENGFSPNDIVDGSD